MSRVSPERRKAYADAEKAEAEATETYVVVGPGLDGKPKGALVELTKRRGNRLALGGHVQLWSDIPVAESPGPQFPTEYTAFDTPPAPKNVAANGAVVKKGTPAPRIKK